MIKLAGTLDALIIDERTVTAAQVFRKQFARALHESAMAPAYQYGPGTELALRGAANDKRQARDPDGHPLLLTGGQNHETHIHENEFLSPYRREHFALEAKRAKTIGTEPNPEETRVKHFVGVALG